LNSFIIRLGVFIMIGNNSGLFPRTYSIKSYKRRSYVKLKKGLIYATYGILILAVLVVTALTMTHLV